MSCFDWTYNQQTSPCSCHTIQPAVQVPVRKGYKTLLACGCEVNKVCCMLEGFVQGLPGYLRVQASIWLVGLKQVMQALVVDLNIAHADSAVLPVIFCSQQSSLGEQILQSAWYEPSIVSAGICMIWLSVPAAIFLTMTHDRVCWRCQLSGQECLQCLCTHWMLRSLHLWNGCTCLHCM